MTRSTHTPGPWTVERATERASGFAGLSVRTADKRYLANLVFQLDDTEGANARLIAAAPELLAACREAFVALPMTKHNEPINAMLKAAIGKAEGSVPRESARPCGCDPGENHLCEQHRTAVQSS